VPLALVVPADAPYSTMAEFVAFLRNADRPVTFASAGVGTPGHLAGELMKLKLNNRLTHVPYRGAGPALNDLVGGHVDFYFPGFPAAVPLMQAGKVKLLAVSSAKRSSVAPGIPTVAETTGIPNFDFTLWVGFFGPRALPMDVAQNLNTDQQDFARSGHQVTAAKRRCGSVGFVDRRIRRLPRRRNRKISGDHQGGGPQTGVMTATPHFLDCITIADPIARSECDEAIQLLCLISRLLRFARNDEIEC